MRESLDASHIAANPVDSQDHLYIRARDAPSETPTRPPDRRLAALPTLFAALEAATRKVTDGCYDRHRHEEFLHSLEKVARAYPRRELHVVVDNYRTHKHPTSRGVSPSTPRGVGRCCATVSR